MLSRTGKHTPGDELLLNSPEHDEWFDAIIDDNVEMVNLILMDLPLEEKERMLNGTLESIFVREELGRWGKPPSIFTITKPLHAAIVYGADKVANILIQEGAKTDQCDPRANNVIHVIIASASIRADEEDALTERYMYLQNILASSQIKQLLLMENWQGFRPVEMAANLGCTLLLEAIFETKGVYLVKEERKGFEIKQFFDISDYESYQNGTPRRQMKSPIYFLEYVDKSWVSRPSLQRVLLGDLLTAWCKAKLLSNSVFLKLWALSRLVFSILFFSSGLAGLSPDSSRTDEPTNVTMSVETTEDYTNNTGPVTMHQHTYIMSDIFIVIILAFVSAVGIIYDIFDCIWLYVRSPPWKNHTMTRKKNLALCFSFTRVTQCETSVAMLILALTYLLQINGYSVDIFIQNSAYVAISFGCIWSMLYFCQALPWIGTAIIAIQRMMQDFGKFLVMLIAFFLSYVLAFRRIMSDMESDESSEQFGSFSQAFYSTFQVLINTVNFRDYDVTDPVTLYLVHIVFVFFVGILLINFLIATMAYTYKDVLKNKDILARIQMVSMTVVTEMRLSWILSSLYRRSNAKYYTCIDGKVYITRIVTKVPRRKTWVTKL